MSTRQVLPKYHFATGEVEALAVEPAVRVDDARREARAAEAQWHPDQVAPSERATVGGIAPPGSAAPSIAAIALNASQGGCRVQRKHSVRSNSYEHIGEARITRRATSARAWRVFFSLLPIALIAWWWWRFL